MKDHIVKSILWYNSRNICTLTDCLCISIDRNEQYFDPLSKLKAN